MNSVDLKKCPQLLNQYIELRNTYIDMLLTEPINKADTLLWLEKNNVELMGLEENGVLEGVVILYLEKGGEVAFFSREKNKGIGTRLLTLVEDVAKIRKLPEIHAWIRMDNPIAGHVFLKCGYSHTGKMDKIFRDKPYPGFIFVKKL